MILKRNIAIYVGDQIRMARLARRLSQRDVAEMCGITTATLCKIERGQTDVRLSTLALIRSTLAIDITIVDKRCNCDNNSKN